jgi:transcription initiation factor IIE alpha subunit
MSRFEEYLENPLWKVLVDTVHSLVMYPHHKAYVRDVVLSETPEITPEQLAARLGISLGEALVILYELREENTKRDEQKKP